MEKAECPKVSIIVPIYNCEKYLENCLDSIAKQSLKEIEIILVNDGSTDKSKSICKQFCIYDDRFKLIEKNNTGVSDSRNIAIKNSTGEYIMFVDADDWIEKNAAEISYKKITEYKADICQFNYFFNYKEKEIKREHFRQYLIEKNHKDFIDLQCNVISDNYVMKEHPENFLGRYRACWGKMFSRKFLIDNNLYFDIDLILHEDTYYLINAFEKMKKIIFLDEYLYHYRQNENSVTKSFDTQKWTKNMKVIKKFQKIAENNDELKICINILFFELLISYMAYDVFNPNKNVKYNIRKKEFKNALNSDIYKEVIRDLNYKYLNKKQKFIYIIIKLKLYILIYLLNIKRKNGEK